MILKFSRGTKNYLFSGKPLNPYQNIADPLLEILNISDYLEYPNYLGRFYVRAGQSLHPQQNDRFSHHTTYLLYNLRNQNT